MVRSWSSFVFTIIPEYMTTVNAETLNGSVSVVLAVNAARFILKNEYAELFWVKIKFTFVLTDCDSIKL